MIKYNAKNERIKRDYFRYQTEAKQKSQTTLNGIRKSIDRFEIHTGHKDFATFNKEQAMAFKKHLSQQKANGTGQPLSKSTVLSTVNALKEFFQWIAWQPGYKSRLHVPDIEYFNLTEKEISIAKATKLKDFPTIEQVRKVIFSMPTEADIQRRDRALIAFTILTGMRDAAIASLKLKHVDLTKDPVLVRQEPGEVNTKFSKPIISHFFPVGDDIKEIAVNWIQELREKKHYSQNDPVFPRTKLGHDQDKSFTPCGLEASCWATTTPIREIFRKSFEAADLPYFSPHRFRDTLVHLGQQICQTPEQFKAWSQSLGHSSPLTTFSSYGTIDPYRQGEVLKKLTFNSPLQEEDRILKRLEKLEKIVRHQTTN